MTSDSIVQEIWNLCHILRDDGITYYQYVSELSYLLFLKIAEENNTESLIPAGCRWTDLESRDVKGLLGYYQEMLTHLGVNADNEVVRAIYAFPTTVFSHSENLKAVIDGIAKLKWHEVGHDRFGQIYSGLIDKSVQDARSAAGQYFTPRSLVDSIIRTIRPDLGELIQDPAAGSGGFLVSTDRFLRARYSLSEYTNCPPRYQGVEIEKNTRRICLMNTFLHGLNAQIIYGDALTADASVLAPPDVIVANPPFGRRTASRRPLRPDIVYATNNKQVAFLQHICNGLKDDGRAAVILPDNVLFSEGVGRIVRRELMKTCNLHTILRLPNGIFSSAGVKTNVLYFTKQKVGAGPTREVWFYDMRTNMQTFGRKAPLVADHFIEFEERFGEDLKGRSDREDEGVKGRFRCFSREDIAKRDDNLDVSWLVSEGAVTELESASHIAAAIVSGLRAAISEIEGVVDDLPEAHGGDLG